MTDLSGGIVLDIDGNNQVFIAEDTDSFDTCVADTKCVYAKRTTDNNTITIICGFKNNQKKNVFTLDKCPAKKWHRLVYPLHPTDMLRAINKKGCYSCGNQKQWRLKRKDAKWICIGCHPSDLFTNEQIETREYKQGGINDE